MWRQWVRAPHRLHFPTPPESTPMNNEVLMAILDKLVAPLLAGFVLAARLKSPTANNADVANEAEGELRHFLRRKLGFLVDILWSIQEFKTPLEAEIKAQVEANPLPSVLTALLAPQN